jgi:hypothetical protein
MYLPGYIMYDDGLEFLGPVEGWGKEKEYCPTWINVEHMDEPNQDGSSRMQAADRCNVDTPVYLFWEKESQRDLNAVAVYRLEARRDRFRWRDQLGYLPAAVAAACLNDYLADSKRFGALVRKIFRSDTGNIDLYLEVIAFYNMDQKKNAAKKQKAECKKWHTESVKSFLSMCSPLAPDKVLALERAGLLDFDKLCATKNADLLQIDGLDREAVAIIRRFYPVPVKRAPKA